MRTDLYNRITDELRKAIAIATENNGGGACCGTTECLTKHPFAEFSEFSTELRTDLPAYRNLRLNVLCGVIMALAARVEELEAMAVAPREVRRLPERETADV